MRGGEAPRPRGGAGLSLPPCPVPQPAGLARSSARPRPARGLGPASARLAAPGRPSPRSRARPRSPAGPRGRGAGDLVGMLAGGTRGRSRPALRLPPRFLLLTAPHQLLLPPPSPFARPPSAGYPLGSPHLPASLGPAAHTCTPIGPHLPRVLATLKTSGLWQAGPEAGRASEWGRGMEGGGSPTGFRSSLPGKPQTWKVSWTQLQQKRISEKPELKVDTARWLVNPERSSPVGPDQGSAEQGGRGALHSTGHQRGPGPSLCLAARP